MSPEHYISHWDCALSAHPGQRPRRRRRLVPRETYDEVIERLGLVPERPAPDRAGGRTAGG